MKRERTSPWSPKGLSRASSHPRRSKRTDPNPSAQSQATARAVRRRRGDGVRRGPRPELTARRQIVRDAVVPASSCASPRRLTRVLRAPASQAEPWMGHSRFRCCTKAGVAGGSSRALPADDEQEHGATLLLLGKRPVLAHMFPSPLAAELDEYEQRSARDAERDARCSSEKRVSSPAGSSRLLGTKLERVAGRRSRARFSYSSDNPTSARPSAAA